MAATLNTLINHQVRLASRPVGLPTRENWQFTTEPVAEPAEGSVLVKTLALSLDPAMRGWMNDGKSYIPPVGIGEVMRAGGIGRVVASKDPAFAVGDLVSGLLGVQEYCQAAAGRPGSRSAAEDRPDARQHRRSGSTCCGMPGMTAYFGLMDVGQPKAGETVVVSGAAGAVGQTVGQLAKIKGCRVVGIAGGAAKCDWVVKELGFDACIDYKGGSVRDGLKAALPEGRRHLLRQRRRRDPRPCAGQAGAARRASSSAARSASTTTPRRCRARRTTCRCWSTARAWKASSCSTTPTATRRPSPSWPAT